ncbi:hypothetical protein F5J12DRAFT_135262 [Pisolithus orientalis]|uniref:uncharacterized protein n=1 Tax=Pisolithus orientalis TaxID=936130 RepID=UPI00222594B7|nr:uncharacterized protein F5J12DRAFT_135262 [Pisolithus orientalis]KAI6005329.1 hypothetical protein F5J12DRAFT_135262 [Pisolithus orientalis]
MSPQRMAIASLLCPDDQPSPAHEPGRVRHPEKPRTIDALLHPAPVPASTQPHPMIVTTTTTAAGAALSTPGTSPSQHRAMSSSFSYSPTDSIRHPFPSPRYSPLHSTRTPFAGLQALVHVASEEHRRISTLDREREHPDSRLHYHHNYNYPRHPDIDYHHRPNKRLRVSRSASPSRPPSPNTDTHPSTPPPPFQSEQHAARGRSASGSSQHRQPPPDSQYSRSYVHLVHPTSRVPHPSTFFPPVSHSQHSPLLPSPPIHLSRALPSPSRHPPLHSLLPQPQSSPQSTRPPPFSGAAFTSTTSVPRMVGGISLLREDVSPPRFETSRHRTDPPYLRVQEHLPVQSPIPRLPAVAWDVRQDTPPSEVILSSNRENKSELQQPQSSFPVVPLPSQFSEFESHTAVGLHLQPGSLPVGKTSNLLMQQRSVQDTHPTEQVFSLPLARTDNSEVYIEAQSFADSRDAQEDGSSVDQSTAKTWSAQRGPTPHPGSPSRTPSSLPERNLAGDTPSPVEILATPPPVSPAPPPRGSPPVASVPASPHSERVAPEHTYSYMTSPRPTPSPPPHAVQREARQGIDSGRTQAPEPENEPSQALAPTKNEKVEEELADLLPEPMAVDDSTRKPALPLELVLGDAPVMPVVSPAIQHLEPELGLKLEGEGGDFHVTEPAASRGSSATPSTCIKAEVHPEADNVDTFLPISSPPEVDCKSARKFEGSHDMVGMDIDVDEELLSLIEDRPPIRRVQPRSASAQAPRVGEESEQGPAVSRASATVTDEEPEPDSALPPIQRTKKGASTTAAKKKKQETASKVRLFIFS